MRRRAIQRHDHPASSAAVGAVLFILAIGREVLLLLLLSLLLLLLYDELAELAALDHKPGRAGGSALLFVLVYLSEFSLNNIYYPFEISLKGSPNSAKQFLIEVNWKQAVAENKKRYILVPRSLPIFHSLSKRDFVHSLRHKRV